MLKVMPDRLRFGLLIVLLATFPSESFSEYTATWTRRADVVNLPAGPGKRQWISTLYDPVNQKVVVFGGSSGYYNDIWHYDTVLDTWTEIETHQCPVVFDFTPPLGRDDFSFAYDEYNDLYWLHGGGGYKCNQGTMLGIAETGTTTSEIFMAEDIPQQALDYYKHFTVKALGRKAYVVGYDPLSHKVTLDSNIAGLGPGIEFGLYPQRGGGTYHYEPAAAEWTGFDRPYWGYDGPRPRGRKGGGFDYSARDHVMVLFGGVAGFTDTWAMDVETKTWDRLIPHGVGLTPRARTEIQNGLVYDRSNDVFVLFGGKCFDAGCVLKESLDDTWVYDYSTNQWTSMNPPVSPPARAWHMMAYDHVNQVTVLFGGEDHNRTTFGDLWVYDYLSNTWTEVVPVGDSPSSREKASLTYDSDQNLFVLYGGTGTKSTRDVWVLELLDDGAIPPNTPPEAHASVNPTAGDTTVEFAFDGSGSFDTDGTIQEYRWEFGDGESATTGVTAHTYVGAGIYTATLTVTDDDGGTDSTALEITVDEFVPPPVLTVTTVVIKGTVDDLAITEVIVDGVPVPVVGGDYEFERPVGGGMTTFVIEATNSAGATAIKQLTVNQP